MCILGMHRSGTSSLTGSLEEEARLYLGEVVTEAPYNLKGNREHLRIRELHEQVLSANGGSWDRPPEEVTWSAEHRARRDAMIAGYPQGVPWGFKDPRTLLTLAGWSEVLPAMRCGGTFRHPLAVAASLGARDGFAVERSLALWAHYNRLLLRYHRELDLVDVVSFDLPREPYLERLAAIAAALGLAPPAGGFTFFESALRKAAAPADAELPAPIASIYRQLIRIAKDGST